MSIHDARVRIAGKILDQYEPGKPLHLFLKEFYRSSPQMGSTDRRTVSALVYNYFRVNNTLPKLPFEERLAAGCFLCEQQPSALLDFILEHHSRLPKDKVGLDLDKKLEIVRTAFPVFSLSGLFPFHEYLSDGIDKEAFFKSMLIQPRVWIRIRKEHSDAVYKELLEKNLNFEKDEADELCLGFKSATALDKLDTYLRGYFEIQDRSSQLTKKYFRAGDGEYWWDCCAGSGGKSLILMDDNPSVRLTISDIRPAILNNLKSRFEKAGIPRFNSFVLDLTDKKQLSVINRQFDGIIADVPCSGSGTWARTPEMISAFRESSLKEFQEKQADIIGNVSPFIKKGKVLIYITCSVFKNENEDAVGLIAEKNRLQVLETSIIRGYERGADTMFAAILVK